jgi:hypothetical protein
MRVQAISASELKQAEEQRGPLPAGEYDFEVAGAEERISQKSGLGMFEVQLKVFRPDGGGFRMVRDYVMAEGQMAWRLRQCCEALGVMSAYERGEIHAHDLEGTAGRCVLSIRKDPSGQYPDQNAVKDYLPKPQSPSRPAGNTAAVRARQPAVAGEIDRRRGTVLRGGRAGYGRGGGCGAGAWSRVRVLVGMKTRGRRTGCLRHLRRMPLKLKPEPPSPPSRRCGRLSASGCGLRRSTEAAW